jgi:hypothetical protein
MEETKDEEASKSQDKSPDKFDPSQYGIKFKQQQVTSLKAKN